MKRTLKHLFIAALMVASTASFATKPVSSEAGPAKVQCDDCLKFATGPVDKGYSNMFRDLKAVCGSRVNIVEVRTKGGLENLSVLAGKKADVGFAQIDTLKAMSAGREEIAALQLVLPMHYNYLHVITRKGGYVVQGERSWKTFGMKADDVNYVLTKFSDQKGRSIALSGSAVQLADALSKPGMPLAGYNMQYQYPADDKEAIAMVNDGRAKAAWILSGAPTGALSALNMQSGITLLKFDEDFGGLGMYSVRNLSYENIGVYSSKAVAVPNALLTRDFGPEKAAMVATLRQCILDNLQKLKDGDYEAGWNEIRPDAKLDIPQFKGAQQAAPTVRKK